MQWKPNRQNPECGKIGFPVDQLKYLKIKSLILKTENFALDKGYIMRILKTFSFKFLDSTSFNFGFMSSSFEIINFGGILVQVNI